jgi:curved DNA-binding protein CbpA
MSNMQDDPYELLGIRSNATAAEIQQAYRRKAFALHPDRNPSVDAAERFRDVQEAYELLSDNARRQAFDDKRNNQLVDDADTAARTIWKAYLGGIRS